MKAEIRGPVLPVFENISKTGGSGPLISAWYGLVGFGECDKGAGVITGLSCYFFESLKSGAQ